MVFSVLSGKQNYTSYFLVFLLKKTGFAANIT